MIPERFRIHVLLATALACLIVLEFFVIGGVIREAFVWVVKTYLLDPTNRAYWPDDLLMRLGWVAGTLFCYFLIPAALIKIGFGQDLHDYGWSFEGYWKHVWIYLLLILPILGAMFHLVHEESFQQTYPFHHPRDLRELLIWEFAYAVQFIALEFFFRGFLVHGAARAYGNEAAVWLMVFPYMMIHYPKPFLECCGAVIAGLVLGWLSLRTKSIFGGATAHILVAWSMDFAVLWFNGWFAIHLLW